MQRQAARFSARWLRLPVPGISTQAVHDIQSNFSGGNILGWQVAGYSEGSHNFLGVVGNAAPNNQLRFGTNLSGSHGPYFLTDICGVVRK